MNSRIAFWLPLPLPLPLTFAVVVILAIHLLDFPGSVPDFRRASGGGTLLDAKPAFSADGVYQRIDAYGAVGRTNCAFRNRTIDVLLPFSVLPFFVLLSRRAAARLGRRGVLGSVMLASPFVYVVFDLVENGVVLAILDRYPRRLSALAFSLSYATIIKRLASLLAFLLPVRVLTVRRWIPTATPRSTSY